MYRSHNCGELNASHINTEVTLAGWVQKSRDKGKDKCSNINKDIKEFL